MGLFNCPECNKEISDKAKMCPHCGYELPKQEPKFQGVYCPSCLKTGIKTSILICPFCHTEFKDSIYGTHKEAYDFCENHPELKEAPEFSEEAYQRRINYVPINYSDINSIKCPTCQSKNVCKMSKLESGASIAMFGIFSKKINKTFKCNSCGYTW